MARSCNNNRRYKRLKGRIPIAPTGSQTIYSQPLSEITWHDIETFLADRPEENVILDYKREPDLGMDGRLLKTINAMANTHGGVILVGVEDKDNRPVLPLRGLESSPDLETRLQNSIASHIRPPLFPQMRPIKSSDGEKTILIIRVDASDLGGHFIPSTGHAYFRTGDRNQPERFIDPDQLLWLAHRREKALDLRSHLELDVAYRFHNFMSRTAHDHGYAMIALSGHFRATGEILYDNLVTFMIGPKYPTQPLRSRPLDRSDWNACSFKTHLTYTPGHAYHIRPFPLGVVALDLFSAADAQRAAKVNYFQMDSYPFLAQRTCLLTLSDNPDLANRYPRGIHFGHFVSALYSFLVWSLRVFSRVAFQGLASIHIVLPHPHPLFLDGYPYYSSEQHIDVQRDFLEPELAGSPAGLAAELALAFARHYGLPDDVTRLDAASITGRIDPSLRHMATSVPSIA